MKKLMITCLTFVAVLSAFAETAVWKKTDVFEDLNNNASLWNQDANWESGTAPQNGDSLSFPNAPDEGVARISSVMPPWGQYVFDTISGLAAYDLTLGRQCRLTVNDMKDFQGVVRVGGNHLRSANGYDSYPAFVTLMATADRVPVINNYDDRFHSAVFVPDAGTKAEIKNVIHSAPGALRKHGAGELEVTFAAGSDQKVYVENGQLTVRETDQSVTLGQALVGPWLLNGEYAPEFPSLGVKDGETVRIGTVAVNGGALTVKGAGELQVGTLVSRDETGKNEVAGKIDVTLENGAFGNLPVQTIDTAKLVSTPALHLDASAADVFTFDADDPTLVTEWRDPDSARTAQGVARPEAGRLPKFVADGLNGKPVLDFGAATDYCHEGDGTAGYVAFPEIQTVRAAFLVYRRKDLTVATPFLGGNEEWKCEFWGYKDVPAALLAYDGEGNPVPGVYLGDARVDGAAIDITKWQFSDNDFHVVSLTIEEDRHDYIGNNGTSYIGAAPYYKQFGGIDLAEAIIYDAPLAAGERVEIEKQLLAKWLPAKATTTARTTELGKLTFMEEGDMTVTANQDLSIDTLSGEGALVKKGAGTLTIGTQKGVTALDVQDGSIALAIKGGAGEAPEALTQAYFRMDPSQESTLTVDADGHVTHVADANGGAIYAGRSLLFSQHPDIWANHVAGPTLVAAETTGLNLLDLGEYMGYGWPDNPNACSLSLYYPDQVTGGSLPGGTDQYWVDAPRTVFIRSGVVVVEKKYAVPGGNDKQAFLSSRLWSKFETSGDKIIDVHPDGAHGTWYFDGVACDPTETVWPVGGVHVIAFTYPEPCQDIPAYLFGQDNDKDSAMHLGGLRYGEVALFKEALSPADLKELAQYLTAKWVTGGKSTAGGFSSMSVGSTARCAIDGNLTVADNSTLTIGVEKSASGSLVVSGTVTLGKNVNVVVENGRGDVPLVQAPAFSDLENLETWTLNGKKFRYTYDETAGVLSASLGRPGLIILIK